MKRTLIQAAVALSLSLTGASALAATAIPGGNTTVTLTQEALNALLPLSPTPIGAASLTPPDVIFPISGGLVLDNGSAIIRHDNSGLGFSADDDALDLTDFVINTSSGVLTGSVAGAIDGGAFDLGPGIPLFDLVGSSVLLTGEAAGAFETVFGVSGLEGFKLGDADVAVVPIPAAALLFGSAIVGLAGISRRRKAG